MKRTGPGPPERGQGRRWSRAAVAYLTAIVSLLLLTAIGTAALGTSGQAWVIVVGVTALGLSVAMAVVRAFRPGLRAPGPPGSSHYTSPGLQQVQEIFTAAVELPTGERSAYVSRACADDRDLRGEIDSLLAAHAPPGALDRPLPVPRHELASVASSAHSVPGLPAGRYEILEQLGSGGMGVVYRARDHRLERIVALKFLPPHLSADPRSKERFLVEARAAAALDHPSICTAYEVGEADDGQLFLAMPCYDGCTLKHRLAEEPLAPEEATALAIQIADGLAHAHDRGVVHRDIKPGNVLITSEGAVKIVDFGIAKLSGVSLTNPGMTPGTIAYMSPEQIRDEEVDGRTDLWSLGVLLYEMLTGERPFRGDHDGALLHAILRAEPRPLGAFRPGIPEALEGVVLRALSRSRADRYAMAREMALALRDVYAGSPGTAALSVAPPGPPDRVGTPPPSEQELSSPAGLLEGELRAVTIVACAVSGYDEIVSSLDPRELEERVRVTRSAVSEIALAHAATLHRFTGDEIVLVFGIPTAGEDDCVRAVRAAFQLRARITAHGEPGDGPALRLHTGIDTGRVIVHALPGPNAERSYRLTGTVGRAAALLAGNAGADEIWTSPECQRLIGPFFQTEARDALTMGDRKQPFIPYRVLGASGARTRLAAAEASGLTAYTGREAELETLRSCLRRAHDAAGQFVIITGEAGIGKSRLLHEFRAAMTDGEVSCLLGRCQPDGGAVPYLPFTHILRAALQIDETRGDGVLESALSRIRAIGPELEEFIPLYLHLLSIPSTGFTVPTHLSGGTLQLAIEEGLAALLTLCARRRPLIVMLEDWHWADDASRSALRQLGALVSNFPLLVIATARTGYGVEWDTPGNHVQLPLRPLQAADTVELLKSLLGIPVVPRDLAAVLHARSSGNPFFLEEICAALVEQGSLRVGDAEEGAAGALQLLDLPDSIEAVIGARLDLLDPYARDLLRLASVVGREFTREILECTVSDRDGLPAALVRLGAAHLIQQIQVVPEAVYRFRHALTREVAYASLLAHQRRVLHARVGAQIEQLGTETGASQVDRLAHHFSRAEEWHKAVGYGIQSAERAGALAQYAEALQILERTQRWLIHIKDAPERQRILLQILLRQERLCETLGLRARQQQLVDELVRLLGPDGEDDTLAEAWLRKGDLHTLQRRYEAGEQALRHSLHICRARSDILGEQKALRSLGLLRWYQGHNDDALEYITRVVAMDRERNDVVALVGDVTSLGNVLRAMGEHREARLRLEEGIVIADAALAAGSSVAADLRVKQAYILNLLAVAYREAGNLDGALELLDRAEAIAEVRRLPAYLPYHHVIVAQISLQKGEVEQSLTRLATAVRLAREVKYLPGLSQALRITGEVLLGLGRYEEAIPHLEEAAALFAQLEDPETEAHLRTEIATAHEAEEDDAGAVAAWTRARALRKQLGDAVGELNALEALGAAIRRHLPDPMRAHACYEDAARMAQELGDRVVEGRLRNTLGILEWSRGEYGLALDHYQRGLTLFEELDDVAHAGLMLNSIGASLRDLGRLAESRSRFEEALALHRETGQRQLEGHALAALGDISVQLGHSRSAADYFERSLEIRRGLGDVRGEGWMLYNLARTAGSAAATAERVALASEFADGCDDPDLVTACEALRLQSQIAPLTEGPDAPLHHRAERR